MIENNTNMVNSANIIGRYRKVLQNFGPYFGQMLLTVKATCPDLKWNEDRIAGKQGLRNEVKAFVIVPIDIVSIKLLEKDLDGQPKIILNEESNDPNLIFPLVSPNFSKATRENVMECIDRANKPNSQPMFFAASDLPLLTDHVRIANQTALNTYEEQARKMAQLAQCVRDMVDANDKLKSDYLRQCGVGESTVSVNIRVEEGTE